MFQKNKVLIVGDIMLDSYLFGEVNRISPEAPVPICEVVIKQNKLGGAANVAKNIKELGGKPILCSIIGYDDKSETLFDLLSLNKITSKYISKSPTRVTTHKTRIVGNNSQMLRIDEELKIDLNGPESKLLLELFKTAIKENNIDVVLFQDYDKGILNKDLIKKLTTIANKENIPILVDPKHKNFKHYSNVKLIKPNFEEFKTGINLEIKTGTLLDNMDNGLKDLYRKELLEVGAGILHKKGIEIVFVTLAENGIFISYKKDKKYTNKIIPAIQRDVSDISGAGDTVISVISTLINSDMDIEEIAKISNIAGGLVCEDVGVVPIDKNKLLEEIEKHD